MGEEEAIASSYSSFLTQNAYIDNRSRWPKLTPQEKINQLFCMVYDHLDALTHSLEGDEEFFSKERYNQYLRRVMTPGDIKYGQRDKSVALSAIPIEHPSYFGLSNFSFISVQDGKTCIDSFDGALETTFYISARCLQAGLGVLVEKFDLPAELNDAARLFQLSEDLEFHVSQLGGFLWEPEEFDQWLDQPKYRHALNHVTAAMRVFKQDADYKISDEFLRGWRTEFYKFCLDTSLTSGLLPLYIEKKGSSPRLDRVEKTLALMGDDISKLNEDDCNRICQLVQSAKTYPALEMRAQALHDRISGIFPLYKFSTLYHSPADKPRFLLEDCEILDEIEKLPLKDVENITPRGRSHLLTTLFNIAAGNEAYKDRAADLALHIEAQSISIAELDEIENRRMNMLSHAVDSLEVFREAKRNWREMNNEEKFPVLLRFSDIHSRIFEIENAAEHILTFEQEPKENGEITYGFAVNIKNNVDREIICRAYGGIEAPNGRVIGLNAKENHSPLDHFEACLSVMAHEQTHLNDALLLDWYKKDRLMFDDPYRKLASLLNEDRNPWRQNKIVEEVDDKEKEKDKKKDEAKLNHKFYRVSITERHAFSVQEKFCAMRQGAAPKLEREILNHAIKCAF